jgi:hypothetical protein
MRVTPTYEIVERPIDHIDIRLSEGEARNLMNVINDRFRSDITDNPIDTYVWESTALLAQEIKKALGNA